MRALARGKGKIMGLGPGEIVLILIIAYVVVGPEDMTKLARTLAKALCEIRKMSADLSREVGEGLSPAAGAGELPGLSGIQKEVEEGLGLSGLQKEVEEGLGLSGAGRKAEEALGLDQVKKEIRAADLDSVLAEIRRAEEQAAP